MPFDYDEYSKKCNGMTIEQLNKEWNNYTRQISAGSTSTATSVLLSPLTGGVSLVGLGLSAPRIHNARKKREIIEAGLQARGTTHNTRFKDVITPMAIGGTVGVVSMGLGVAGAEDFTLGLIEHHDVVVDYAATTAAASAAGTYVKYRSNERLQKIEEVHTTLEPGLSTAQTWPLDQEKHGIVPPPMPHLYSIFGQDEHVQQESFQVSTHAQLTTSPPTTMESQLSNQVQTSISTGIYYVSDPQHETQQNGRSKSLPLITTNLHTPPATQVIQQINQVHSVEIHSSQNVPLQNLQEPPGDAVTGIISADMEDDELLAALSLEEQMLVLKMRLIQLEIAKRKADNRKSAMQPLLNSSKSEPVLQQQEHRRTESPVPLPAQSQSFQVQSTSKLHRSNHVHATHGRSPRSRNEGEHEAQKNPEKNQSFSESTRSPLTVIEPHQQRYQLSESPTNSGLALPIQAHSLPVTSYPPEHYAPSSPNNEDNLAIPKPKLVQPPPQETYLPPTTRSYYPPPQTHDERQQERRNTEPALTQPQPQLNVQRQYSGDNFTTPPPPATAAVQPQTSYAKAQRQDSGYYSAFSTPAIPNSTYPAPAAAPYPPALNTINNAAQETFFQQQQSASYLTQSPQSIQSQASFPYIPYQTQPQTHPQHQTSTPTLSQKPDYFNQTYQPPTTPETHVPTPVNNAPVAINKRASAIFNKFAVQWGAPAQSTTASTATGVGGKVMNENKTGSGQVPNYGPPPPIPSAWKG